MSTKRWLSGQKNLTSLITLHQGYMCMQLMQREFWCRPQAQQCPGLGVDNLKVQVVPSSEVKSCNVPINPSKMWQAAKHKSAQVVCKLSEQHEWGKQFCASKNMVDYQENLNNEICVIIEPFSQIE